MLSFNVFSGVDKMGQHLQQSQQGTEVDGRLDRQCEHKAEMSVMFTEEDEHGLIEHVDIAVGRLLCRPYSG